MDTRFYTLPHGLVQRVTECPESECCVDAFFSERGPQVSRESMAQKKVKN